MKKMQRREGVYLSSVISTFGMKGPWAFSSPRCLNTSRSYNVELSTFFAKLCAVKAWELAKLCVVET
jgi:hypothetical protein